MTPRGSERPLRSLDLEIRGAFRVMLMGVTAILVITALGFAWLGVVSQPRLEKLNTAVGAAQDAHAGLLDQQTAVRGYVATGDEQFLDLFRDGEARVDAANERLEAALGLPKLAQRVLSFRIAQDAWQSQWGAASASRDGRAALLRADGTAEPDLLAAALQADDELFDEYRSTQTSLLDAARAEQSTLRDRQLQVLTLMFVSILVICTALGTVAGLRRRRLQREVIAPIHTLVGTVDSVASGELVDPPRQRSATEVMELRDGLSGMVNSLSVQRTEAERRQQESDETARRLREVLQFAREVSGSLSIRYVLDAVTTAACGTTESDRARVWLVDDESGALLLAFDSKLGRKVSVDAVDCPMGVGAVGRAAKYGQVSYSGDLEGDTVPDTDGAPVVGFPLIVGARVVGVLEIHTEAAHRFDDEVLELVETLASHSAAALEAARLYQDSEELSSSDALTGLANRRRLDADLEREVELALRHHRPLGFIMLDLDHFKRVNDTYGHQQGDQILQDVAEILRDEARPGDTVYRYGGEELAVVVRESDADGTAVFAERLRLAVEQRFTRAGVVTQTMSAGVAALPRHAASAGALIAAADAALYAAKLGGRNRVELAAEGQATDPTSHRDGRPTAGGLLDALL